MSYNSSRLHTPPEVIDFIDFLHVPDVRAAGLDPSIIAAAKNQLIPGRPCYAEDDMAAAIAQAGQLLRGRHGMRLSAEPIKNASQQFSDRRAAILASIVNASHMPERATNPALSFTSDRCKHSPGIDACAQSELRFTQTISSMEGSNRQFRNLGYQIIAHAGKPVFLRKGHMVPSALALTDFVVSGIPYPAGSITRVDITSDATYDKDLKEYVQGYPVVPEDYGEIIPVESVVKVGFMRLSSFVLQQSQAVTARSGKSRMERPNDASQWSIEQIACISQQKIATLSTF